MVIQRLLRIRRAIVIYGNVKTDDHDHFVVPLNDGVGKPSGHEYGDRKNKF